MKAQPTIPLTVVVPALGRPAQTERLLASIALSTHLPEVIVVDDGSAVPLNECVRTPSNLCVRFLRQDHREGPAAARNRGVREAETELIAFTDNDCVVHPNWAHCISTYLGDLPQHFAGVGGRTIPLGNDVFSRYYGYHKTLDPWLEGGRYLYVVTANAAFRRSALDRVGGFDERVVQAGGEDPGVCFKLQNAGFSLAYDAEAVIWHEFRPSLRDFVRTFHRYGAGCRHQAEKHGVVQPRRPPTMTFGIAKDR